jgi:4-hydroxybenzoate polyprenyltransferase
MLFFPPFLGGMFSQPSVLNRGIIPFFSFCMASSATYILNDILDAEHDAHHPAKMSRPIPAGSISRAVAAAYGCLLVITAIVLGNYVSNTFMILLVAYILISSLYSLLLKDLPIVDVFCIAAGFILRLEAGGEAFGAIISDWLFLSVFLLAIFLSTGKRLSEKNALGVVAGSHRKSLLAYPDGFLDGTLFLTGSAVLVTYTIYTTSRSTLVYSVPLCTFGILRYLFRLKSGGAGDPTESLLKDLPLFFTGILWLLMVGWSIYR